MILCHSLHITQLLLKISPQIENTVIKLNYLSKLHYQQHIQHTAEVSLILHSVHRCTLAAISRKIKKLSNILQVKTKDKILKLETGNKKISHSQSKEILIGRNQSA